MWLAGSPWLLDTVGGSLERWGGDGSTRVRVALLAVVIVKLAAIATLWLAVRRGRRGERILAWTAGVVLTLYGGVLTVAGIAIVAFGTADLSQSDDPRAIRWHAWFWDPWFLLWGICTLAALHRSSPRQGRPKAH